jgi:uncharacterized protein YbjT (DUF2867 family)
MDVNPSRKVLVVGPTGSIGRLVVGEALRQAYLVRALVRDAGRAQRLPPEAEIVVGDVTRPDTLTEAVHGVQAIVFTLGSEGKGKAGAEAVDYGGVRNVLAALGSRTARIVLMTAIGVTNRDGAYNQSTEAHDWKRRGERLVRISGLPYTIVRPGWFDYNGPNENLPVLLQGDTRQTSTPRDGAIARSEIAKILVHCLRSDSATRKTFELVSTNGTAPDELVTLFRPLEADRQGEADGVSDAHNMPPDKEPKRVRDDLSAEQERRAARSFA